MEISQDYFVFISYSSLDNEWALWLRHELEHYHLPASFNGRTDVRDNLRIVFRDRDELSAGPEWDNQVKKALANTHNLIVICSPHAAQSEAVNKEIETFIALGKEDYIFPFIVDGDKPIDCFPPALKHSKLGGDVNKDGGRDIAFVKVVAGILKVNFSSLWNHYEIEKAEEERKQREQKEKLLIAQSRFVAERAKDVANEGDSYLASKLIIEVLPDSSLNHPYTPEAESALRYINTCNSAVFSNFNFFCKYANFCLGDQYVIILDYEDNLSVLDANSGALLKSWKNEKIIGFDITLHSKGELMCYKVGAGLEIHNLNTGIVKSIQGFEKYRITTSHAFCPNGEDIAYGENNIVKVINIETGDIKRVFKTPKAGMHVNKISFSPDNSIMITAYEKDGLLIIWDMSTGKVRKELNEKSERNAFIDSVCQNLKKTNNSSFASECFIYFFSSLAFNQDGSLFLTAFNNGVIKIWDTKHWKCLFTIKAHSTLISMVSFAPIGNIFASAACDGTIKIWNGNSGELINTFKGHHSKIINTAFFSKDGNRIISSSDDATVRIWDMSVSQKAHILKGHSKAVKYVQFSPDGYYIASISDDNTIRVWRTTTLTCIFTIDNFKAICPPVFSNDSRLVICASSERIKVWDAYNGMLIQDYENRLNVLDPIERELRMSYLNDNNQVCYFNPTASLSTDGKILAYCDINKKSIITQNVTTNDLCVLENSSFSRYHRIVISDDGNFVASQMSDEGDIGIWNTNSGTLVTTIENTLFTNRYYRGVSSMAFSPNNEMIVFSCDEYLYLFNLKNNKKKCMIQEQTEIYSVLWSKNIDFLIVATISHVCVYHISGCLIWKSSTSQTTHYVYASINKDNTIIAATDANGNILLWDYPPLENLINKTRERFKNRLLTPEERRKYYLE